MKRDRGQKRKNREEKCRGEKNDGLKKKNGKGKDARAEILVILILKIVL